MQPAERSEPVAVATAVRPCPPDPESDEALPPAVRWLMGLPLVPGVAAAELPSALEVQAQPLAVQEEASVQPWEQPVAALREVRQVVPEAQPSVLRAEVVRLDAQAVRVVPSVQHAAAERLSVVLREALPWVAPSARPSDHQEPVRLLAQR